MEVVVVKEGRVGGGVRACANFVPASFFENTFLDIQMSGWSRA